MTFLDARSRTFYGVVSADLTPDTVLTASVEYQRNISHGFGSGFLFYSDGSRTDFNRSVANNTPLGAPGHGIHHLFRRSDPPLRQ